MIPVMCVSTKSKGDNSTSTRLDRIKLSIFRLYSLIFIIESRYKGYISKIRGMEETFLTQDTRRVANCHIIVSRRYRQV